MTSLVNCVNFDKANLQRWRFAIDFSNKRKEITLIRNIEE